VVIIVIDGARVEESFGDETSFGGGYSDAWNGPTEEIMPQCRERLLPAGALVQPGYATGLPLTMPAHMDLLQGARRSLGAPPLGDGPGRYRPDLPLLHELISEQYGVAAEDLVLMGNTVHLQGIDHSNYPGLGVAHSGTWQMISDGSAPDTAGEESPANFDTVVLARTRQALEDGATMVLANLHMVDRSGHNSPKEHPEYIQTVDEPITELWSWVQSDRSGVADRTLMVIVSDHGRHRFFVDEAPWTGHGDDCSGCHEIPILLLGPGIAQGIVSSSPYILEDISQTAAWMLGVDMPHGTGLVMEDLLEDPGAVQQRAGQVSVAFSNDLLASQQWTDDPANRSALLIDGELIGDLDAIHVEAPKVARRDDLEYACWRQLTVGIEHEVWPWEGHCVRREGRDEWQDIGFPEWRISPTLEPAIDINAEGELVMAFGSISPDSQPMIVAKNTQMRIAVYNTDLGWLLPEGGGQEQGYSLDPSMVIANRTWLAIARGEDNATMATTRAIEVYSVSQAGQEDQVWQQVYSSLGDPLYERMEHPALTAQGESLSLAFHGYREEGVDLLIARRRNGGMWTHRQIVDASGRVFPHVSPAWSPDDLLYWARLGDDTAEICRLSRRSLGEPGATVCLELGVLYVDSIAPYEGGVWLSASAGGGQWELQQLDWPDDSQ